MKSAQTKTIARLVEIKTRNAEVAEAAYATAAAALTLAETARSEAETTLMKVVDGVATVASSGDLEDRDRHVLALRRRLMTVDEHVRLRRDDEARALRAMREARMEKKRFETWLERESAAATVEARRVERIAEDDVASRKRLGFGD